jgi:hypothetical protein
MENGAFCSQAEAQFVLKLCNQVGDIAQQVTTISTRIYST